MHQIHKNLFVGPRSDYENDVAHRKGWRVVHAAKEPYHREAVGYRGTSPPPSHPEYLFAKREHRLMLNLIDAPVEVDIPKAIFDAALAFIYEGLASGDQLLIHCNHGVSRSASIGLLFLWHYYRHSSGGEFPANGRDLQPHLPTTQPWEGDSPFPDHPLARIWSTTKTCRLIKAVERATVPPLRSMCESSRSL